MDLNALFSFGSSFSRTPVCVSTKGLGWDANCRIVKRDYTGVILPLDLKQTSGRKWTDILNPCSVSMYFVSKRFIDLLDQNSITGWRAYPITITDKEGEEVSDYTGFSVEGKCGAIDYTKSEVSEKRRVPEGPLNRYYRGLYVGMDEWDGTDFFIPKDTLHMIVTNKVVEIIKNHKITNVVLKSLADYEIPEYALPKGFKPRV